VTLKKHPAGRFVGAVALDTRISVQDCPASRTVARASSAAASLSGTPFGINERAKIVEAVGSDESRGYQFPQSGFDFSLELTGRAHNIGKERSATVPQELKHLPSNRAQALALVHTFLRQHPVGLFADEERDRRHAGGNHATATAVAI